ncbi:MAG: hypothetical protein QUS33_13725 [Dehalococcoidia bacterium]|nr:hypothetical protein [Dehalococcoidia bacterium]
MYDTSQMMVLLTAFWWVTSLVLITLSTALLHWTWTGRERAFSIGKKAMTEPEGTSNPEHPMAKTSDMVVGYVGFFVGLVIVFALVP